mgnify:CR=1 FL=1
MKKIFSFVVVMAAVAMVSCCGNSNKKAAEGEAAAAAATTEAAACTECTEKCDSTEACCAEKCDSTKDCAEKAEGESRGRCGVLRRGMCGVSLKKYIFAKTLLR